jgi:hypothetical protein
VREALAQNLIDFTMARGAELGLRSDQQRAMIRGVRFVAFQTLTFDRRHVPGATGAARGLVAVETEAGTVGRRDDGLCLLVAAVAGELGMDRGPQQILAGGAVWRVAGLAVHARYRVPAVSVGKAVGVVMTAAT